MAPALENDAARTTQLVSLFNFIITLLTAALLQFKTNSDDATMSSEYDTSSNLNEAFSIFMTFTRAMCAGKIKNGRDLLGKPGG